MYRMLWTAYFEYFTANYLDLRGYRLFILEDIIKLNKFLLQLFLY